MAWTFDPDLIRETLEQYPEDERDERLLVGAGLTELVHQAYEDDEEEEE